MKKVLVVLFVLMVLSAGFVFAEDDDPDYCATPQSQNNYIREQGETYGQVGAAAGAIGSTAVQLYDGYKQATTGQWGDAAKTIMDTYDQTYDATIDGYNIGRNYGESGARSDIDENCDTSYYGN